MIRLWLAILSAAAAYGQGVFTDTISNAENPAGSIPPRYFVLRHTPAGGDNSKTGVAYAAADIGGTPLIPGNCSTPGVEVQFGANSVYLCGAGLQDAQVLTVRYATAGPDIVQPCPSCPVCPTTPPVADAEVVWPRLEHWSFAGPMETGGLLHFNAAGDVTTDDPNYSMLVTKSGIVQTPAVDFNLSASKMPDGNTAVVLDSNTQTNILAGSIWAPGTIVWIRWQTLR